MSRICWTHRQNRLAQDPCSPCCTGARAALLQGSIRGTRRGMGRPEASSHTNQPLASGALGLGPSRVSKAPRSLGGHRHESTHHSECVVTWSSVAKGRWGLGLSPSSPKKAVGSLGRARSLWLSQKTGVALTRQSPVWSPAPHSTQVHAVTVVTK